MLASQTIVTGWFPAEAQEFNKQFEAAMVVNAELIGTPAVVAEDETAHEADKLAEVIEKVTVTAAAEEAA